MFKYWLPSHWSTIRKLVWLKATALAGEVWRTVTGAIASFTTLRSAPLRSLTVDIEPVQSGSGDPSPDNVRALNGWPYSDRGYFTFCKTGKNMFVRTWIAKSGKYVNLYGTHSPSNSDYYKRSRGVYLEKNKTYRVYCDPGLGSAASWGIFATRTGSTTQLTIAQNASRQTLNTTYKPTYSGYYQPWFYAQSESTVTSIVLSDFIFYIAEGDGAYDPNDASAGSQIQITNSTPPGKVFAGTLDVITGVLKVRPYYSSYNGETLVGPWVSSMDVYSDGATPTTGAQVVDLGGAETEYALTPTEISTLVGVNHIWSESGDVTVEYRAN